jgi:hypothetical protein
MPTHMGLHQNAGSARQAHGGPSSSFVGWLTGVWWAFPHACMQAFADFRAFVVGFVSGTWGFP